MAIDIGRLTGEQTEQLLRDVISQLTETRVIEILCEEIKGDMRAELIASLEAAGEPT